MASFSLTRSGRFLILVQVVRSRRYHTISFLRDGSRQSQNERERCPHLSRGMWHLDSRSIVLLNPTMQIVKVRFGTGAHLLFTFYGFLCILVVCGSLLRMCCPAQKTGYI